VASQALVATFFVLCHAFEAPSSTFCVVVLVSGAELSLVLLDWLHPVTATAARTAKSKSVFFIPASPAVEVPFSRIGSLTCAKACQLNTIKLKAIRPEEEGFQFCVALCNVMPMLNVSFDAAYFAPSLLP
jgi:hypothetical protein